MLELMGWSPRRVIKDTHNGGIELTDRSCMTGCLAENFRPGIIERLARDERKLDNEMERLLENGYEKAS